jgi:hypothetical protein
MEEVTSSSILNKTHVDQEKPTFDSTPMMVLAPSNNVQQIILSGNMGVNSSQNMEGNSKLHVIHILKLCYNKIHTHCSFN